MTNCARDGRGTRAHCADSRRVAGRIAVVQVLHRERRGDVDTEGQADSSATRGLHWWGSAATSRSTCRLKPRAPLPRCAWRRIAAGRCHLRGAEGKAPAGARGVGLALEWRSVAPAGRRGELRRRRGRLLNVKPARSVATSPFLNRPNRPNRPSIPWRPQSARAAEEWEVGRCLLSGTVRPFHWKPRLRCATKWNGAAVPQPGHRPRTAAAQTAMPKGSATQGLLGQ